MKALILTVILASATASAYIKIDISFDPDVVMTAEQRKEFGIDEFGMLKREHFRTFLIEYSYKVATAIVKASKDPANTEFVPPCDPGKKP